METLLLSDSNISTVVGTTKDAITVATPAATKFYQFLASTDPLLLAEYGLGAAAILYLSPAILGGLGNTFRWASEWCCLGSQAPFTKN